MLALYADLPFMYVFVLVADDLWAGRVFKGDGGSQGWRRLGCYQASRVVATGGVRHAGEQCDGLAAG